MLAVPLMLVLPSLPIPVGGEADPQRGLSFPQTSLHAEHDAGPSVGCTNTGAGVLVLRECF